MKKFLMLFVITVAAFSMLIAVPAMAADPTVSGVVKDNGGNNVAYKYWADTDTLEVDYSTRADSISAGATETAALTLNAWDTDTDSVISGKDMPWNLDTWSEDYAIKNLVIGGGIKRLGREMFYGLDEVENVYIPNGVGFEWGVFRKCTSIKNFYCGDYVTFGQKMFRDCPQEINVYLGANYTFVSGCFERDVDGTKEVTNIYSYDADATKEAFEAKNVTVKDSYTFNDYSASGSHEFKNASGVSFTSTFDAETGVLTVSQTDKTAKTVNMNLTSSWDGYRETLPWNNGHAGYKSLVKKVVMDDSVYQISSYVFDGMDNLEEAVISGGSMGYGFRNCTKLKKVEFTGTGNNAVLSGRIFEACSALTDIYLPTNISIISLDNFKLNSSGTYTTATIHYWDTTAVQEKLAEVMVDSLNFAVREGRVPGTENDLLYKLTATTPASNKSSLYIDYNGDSSASATVNDATLYIATYEESGKLASVSVVTVNRTDILKDKLAVPASGNGYVRVFIISDSLVPLAVDCTVSAK